MPVEHPSDLLDRLVTRPAPIARVVGGESVHIEQHEAQRPAAHGGGKLFLQHEPEQPPVGQTGDRVAVRQDKRVAALSMQQFRYDRHPDTDGEHRQCDPEQQDPLHGPAQPILRKQLEGEDGQRADGQHAKGSAPTAVEGEQEGGDQDQQPRERVVALQKARLGQSAPRRHNERREAEPQRPARDDLPRSRQLLGLDLR